MIRVSFWNANLNNTNDEEAKTFLADRYITGECPHCHNPHAYGDQCEKCGKDLSPTELINPESKSFGF